MDKTKWWQYDLGKARDETCLRLGRTGIIIRFSISRSGELNEEDEHKGAMAELLGIIEKALNDAEFLSHKS